MCRECGVWNPTVDLSRGKITCTSTKSAYGALFSQLHSCSLVWSESFALISLFNKSFSHNELFSIDAFSFFVVSCDSKRLKLGFRSSLVCIFTLRIILGSNCNSKRMPYAYREGRMGQPIPIPTFLCQFFMYELIYQAASRITTVRPQIYRKIRIDFA
jgi:hypothetical protein